MSSKNRKTFFTAVLVVCMCVQALQAHAVPAFVSHVIYDFREEEIVFNVGSSRGIKPGDVFEVVREGERLAVLEAVEVTPFYTRMQVLEAEREKEEEGIVGTIISAAEDGSLQMPDADTQEAGAQPDTGEPPLELKPRTQQPSTGQQQPPPETPTAQTPQPAPREDAQRPPGETPPPPAPEKTTDPDDTSQSPAITADDFIVKDEELEEKVREKELDVQLSGFRYLKYRTYSADGDETNFLSRNGLLTQGNTYEQGTQLQVTMTYGDDIQLDGSFFEMPYQERDMEFELNAGHYRALFGDVATDLRTGELAKIQKEIVGTQVQYTTDKLEMDYLVSRSRSEPRTVSFFGDNTHGPFSLEAFEVLENSETVRVNGETVTRGDYDIDYFLGQITFCKEDDSTDCRIIKSSDRVQVEFEEKLLLALQGGNLFGFSSKYNFSEKQNLGFSYVEQEANEAGDRIREAASFSITGSGIDSQADCPDSSICLPQTYQDTYTLMAKNFEKVFLNGQVFTDYSIDDEGYAKGRIDLTAPYSASDVFRVDYSFYLGEFVQKVQLGDENSEYTGEDGSKTYFILRKSRIYEGTETVYYCRGSVEDPCTDRQLLEPDQDYYIYEENNAISVDPAYAPSDIDERYIQISYLYVPTSSEQDSKFDHTVAEIYGGASLGGVELEFDFGRSESDIARTPVQVLREQVTAVTASYTCPLESGGTGECVFFLENGNIVELSESITLTTSGTPLQRGLDYEIEYDTGVLELKGGLLMATDTIVFADYQYNPDVPEGIATGKASRLKAGTKIKSFNIGLELHNTDTYFSPIGGNNTLETSRLDLNLDGSIGEGLTLAFNKSSFDVAKDVFESSTVENDQLQADLSYRTSAGYTFEYSYGADEAVDDLKTHKTDNTRKMQGIAIGLPGIWKPELELKYARRNEDYTDSTGADYDTSTTQNTIEATYKKSDYMDLKAAVSNTEVDASGLGEPYSTTNETRNLVLSFYPFDLITVDADINHQRKNDSRPDAGVSGRDKTSIRVSSRPFGNVKSASVNVINQSYPGQFSGNTNSKTVFGSFAYGLTTALTMTPSITRTDTGSPTSGSSSDRKSLMLDYRPYQKKYSATLKREWGETESYTEGLDPTTSDQTRLNWDLLYKFSDQTNMVYRFDNQENSFSTGNTSETKNQSLTFLHIPGGKQRYSLVYRTSDRSDSLGSSQEQSYRFESDVKLSEIIRWTTKYNMSDYSSDSNPASEYKGYLLESEFRAEF